MAQFTLPHFGILDSENLNSYYKVTATIAGHEIDIDLNFDGEKTVPPGRIATLQTLLDSLPQQLANSREYLISDYTNEDSDSVKFYLRFHKEDTDEAELRNDLNLHETDDLDTQLISKLHPVRIGLYPGKDDAFAIFDYSFGRDFTDYMLVVSTGVNGGLTDITVES